jgi:hypothetical protein
VLDAQRAAPEQFTNPGSFALEKSGPVRIVIDDQDSERRV